MVCGKDQDFFPSMNIQESQHFLLKTKQNNPFSFTVLYNNTIAINQVIIYVYFCIQCISGLYSVPFAPL